MAIEAISSVRTNGIINFEGRGKKDKSANTNHVSSPLKAVPLAAIIAMSPLTKADAGNIMRSERNQYMTEQTQDDKVKVKSTEVDIKRGSKKILSLISTDDNPSNFELVTLRDPGEELKVGPFYMGQVIQGLDNLKINFRDADGHVQNYSKTLARGYLLAPEVPKSHDLPNIIAMTNELLKVPSNNALKVYNSNIDFYMSYNHYTEPNKQMKNAISVSAMTKNLDKNSETVIQGSDNCKYTVRTYYKRGSRDELGFASVQKEGYPELFVHRLLLSTIDLKSNAYQDQAPFATIKQPIVVLMDMDYEDNKYFITDNNLYKSVLQIAKDCENVGKETPFGLHQAHSDLYYVPNKGLFFEDEL